MKKNLFFAIALALGIGFAGWQTAQRSQSTFPRRGDGMTLEKVPPAPAEAESSSPNTTAGRSAPTLPRRASPAANADVTVLDDDASRFSFATAWGHESTPELAAFSRWCADYLAADKAGRRSSEAEGVRLAQTRRAALRELIERDPAAALAGAVPMAIRQELPASIQAQLEERVGGKGDLWVLAAQPGPAPTENFRAVHHRVAIGGRTWDAFVYGWRAGDRSSQNISLHGLAVDSQMAVSDQPIRLLESGETLDPEKLLSDTRCPISKKETASDRSALIAESGDQSFRLCGPSHLGPLAQRLLAEEGAGSPGAPVAPAYQAKGTKRVLVILVDFPDRPGAPASRSEAQNKLSQLDDWFQSNSYHQLSLANNDVTPTLRMPRNGSFYSSAGNGDDTLLADARTAARNAGLNPANYQFDVVVFRDIGFPWGGLGFVGAKGAWVQGGFNLGTAAHELGHNLGLWHAGSWDAATTIDSGGRRTDYGNTFDVMGKASTFPSGHHSANFKFVLGWLTSAHLHTVTANGTYRIYAQDFGGDLVAGRKYGLRIPAGIPVLGTTVDYWVDFRQLFTSVPALQNGAVLQWGNNTGHRDASLLLDTTPGSFGGKNDAAVTVGQTFTDLGRNITIRTVAKGGSGADSYLDVAVNVTTTSVPLAEALDNTALAWTAGGNASWAGQTSVAHDGADAAQSGSIGHSQESWLQTTVTGPGTLSFWWKVSSESTHDFLEFRVDGAVQGSGISGEMDWTQRSVDLATGTHTLRWRYFKNTSTARGQDRGWVDQVAFTSTGEPPVITYQPLNQTVSRGDTATFSVAASGTSPLAYHWRKNGANIAGATGTAYAIHNAQVGDAGTYSVVVSNPFGAAASANATLTVVTNLTLAAALDGAGLTWTTGGEAPWLGQTSVTHDGTDAAQSGSLTDGQESWVQTTLNGPGTLSFWWKVSSEAGYDALEFLLDNTLQGVRLSGEAGWAQRTADLPSGPHTLRWHYAKDSTFSGGQDSAWLDQVSFISGGVPPAITVAPISQTVAPGATVTFSVTASGTAPLSYQWRKNGANLAGATAASYTINNAQTANGGNYSVVAANPYGSVTSPAAVLTVTTNGNSDFRIVSLGADGAQVVDHNALTSDDRGGIAVSASQVFVTGDAATARFAADDLSAGIALDQIYDGLVTDLRTESVYLLGNGTTPLGRSGGTLTSLIPLNGSTGVPTGAPIALTQSITLPASGLGIFSGYGRVVIHNGTRVYDIATATGAVTDRGPMTPPSWSSSESWAVWGVAEFFGGALYLTYASGSDYPITRIARARVPDGLTATVATFDDLADLASFTVSPSRGRWYFHYEGAGQFGGSAETLGFANAALSYSAPNSPPAILTQPASRNVSVGAAVSLTVSASGAAPLGYQWRKNGANLAGAKAATYTIASAATSHAGKYTVVVSNPYGAVTSQVAILTVTLGGSLGEALDALEFVWISGGDNQWSPQAAVTHDGVDAAMSGPITHHQESWVQTTLNGPGMLAYWWRVSSETNYDFLALDIDGVPQDGRLSGEANWEQRTITLDSGSHTVRWRYFKDGSVNGGQDRGWVDQVTFTPDASPPVITSQPLDQTAPMGSVASFRVTASGAGPLAYQWRKNGQALSDATAATLSLPNVQSGDVGDYSVTIANLYGSVTSDEASLTVIPALSLGEALNRPAAKWTTGGAAPWYGEATVTHDGADAARSGAVGTSQSSWVETAFTNAGTLSFWWKVSSEEDYDLLQVLVDGVALGVISGEVGWEQRSYRLGPGSHRVRWVYSKDGSITAGDDAGWLDQVSFIPLGESVVPRITVTRPGTAYTRVLQPQLEVAGTASDNIGLAGVLVQRGTDLPVTANGLTSWTATVTLRLGTNVIKSHAVDTSGNRSATNSRAVFYAPGTPLELTVIGPGRVTGATNGQWLEIGKRYPLRAVPAAGHWFSHWSGSYGGTNLALSVVAVPQLTLTAHFLENPFIAAQGVYHGLFSTPGAGAHANAGAFKLTLNAAGGFSGQVRMGLTVLPFSGAFRRDLHADLVLTRRGRTPLALNLTLDPAGQVIQGEVTDGLFASALLADRGAFSAARPARDLAGTYTLVFSEDPLLPHAATIGQGFGRLVVAAAGTATFSGTMADNTAVTCVASVSRDGLFPLYVGLYGGRGSLFGWLLVKVADPDEDVVGQLIATRPAGISGLFATTGFTLNAATRGFRYTAPPARVPAFDLVNGRVAFDGRDLPTPGFLEFGAQLDALNRILLAPPNPQRVTLTLTPATGLITGTFVRPGTNKTAAVKGVVLQKLNRGVGLFVGPKESGAFYLGP